MKTFTSNPKNAPKHIQKRKDFKLIQEKAKAEKRSKLQTSMVFIVFAIVIGAGLFVYNMDEVYLHDKKNITLSYSTSFQQGGDAPIVVTLTDFEGAPVSEEEVKIELKYTEDNITKQIPLETATTGTNGAITPILELPDEYNGSAELIVSVGEQKIEQKITITEPLISSSPVAEERLKILISTDKPLYQPDQTIEIRTLAMFGENKGVYTDKLTLEVHDPDGNKLSKTELACDSWGIASTNFTVTDQMPIGNYKIIAKVGNYEAQKSVTIKKYVLPRFNIAFNDLKSWYTVDEDIIGSINCKYFFGKVVKGTIEFKARSYYGGIWDTVFSTSGTLSEDGNFEFTVPKVDYTVGLPSNQDNGLVELNATITDPSGHAETKLMPITIARQSILITTISDTNIVGAESRYYVLAQAPDGSIIDNANVVASLDSMEFFDGYTNSRGFSEIEFEYAEQKEMGIKVTKASSSAEETVELKPSKGLKLVTDRLFYDVGDKAEFNVFYMGDSFTKWTYYDVISNGFTITTGCFQLTSTKAGTGSFELDLTPEMVGSTYVRVYKIEKDEDVVSDKLELAVAPVSELNIDIEKDDEIYNPGQPVTLKFKITEGDTAIAAALGISIIDQSLYALSETYGGFEDLYFELEQTALEPRYQLWEYIFSPDTPSSSIPLPETNILDPGEYDEGYSYPKIGLQSNWNSEQDNADSVRSDYINSYWSGVFIITFLGLVGLAVVGARRSRPVIVVVILALLVVATVVGGVVLNLDEISITQDGEPLSNGDAKDGGAGNATGGEGEAESEAEAENVWDWDLDDGAEAMGGGEFPPVPAAINERDKDTYNGYEPKSADEQKTTDTTSQREPETPRVREWFPETWYWNPVLITDKNGEASVSLTTPDSITTWEIKTVGSTQNAKIGVSNENLTVFQQFFIEPDIPVSVVRNDTFPLRIMVYNYDNISHEVSVTLEEDSWFEVLDDTTQKVTVPADNVSKVMFDIRALEVGEHDVTVSGTDGISSDMVVKPMRVDPDGKMVSKTINGKLSDNQSITETIIKTSTRVPESENAFIKLQAGMEAVLLDGAETFIRRVSGCGEQSMSSLNIDILAFDTVTKLGTSTEEKMFEYELIVTDGVQHELQYLLPAKNGKGRGIVWFPDDEDVHQWLTSWGLITFQDAIDAGFDIDTDIITDMQTWLLSQQEDDGSFVFPERGLYEYTNPILRSKTVSCSAYITRSLIYSGYSPSNPAIQRAVNYIEDHAKDNWDDPYTISIVLIVLEDANGDSTLRNELSARLEELKKDDGNGTIYWSSGTSMITDSDDMEFGWGRGFGYGSNYHSIETTGYALMALAKSKSPASQTVQGAIKYLIENRQGLGGWFSTQDTVVAFQALKIAGANKIDKLNVEIYADNSLIDKITFDKSNVDLTFLTDLRPYLGESTQIKVKSIGSGSVMYQIYYEEYIPWEIIGADKPQELILNISYDTTNIKVNDMITANLELKYMGTADHIKMVLVDLRAPVGFSFVEEDFEAMKTSGTISQYEINNRQAYLYIEDLSYGESIKVTYRLEANDPIRATIQGVQAYDMYNPYLISELEPVEITVSE